MVVAKRALVGGGAGFIGSNLVRRRLADGAPRVSSQEGLEATIPYFAEQIGVAAPAEPEPEAAE
ncbi:MAG: hypothetical protein ABR588_06050 [Sphingomicrobium sp.]